MYSIPKSRQNSIFLLANMAKKQVFSVLFIALSFCGIIFILFSGWKLLPSYEENNFSTKEKHEDFTPLQQRKASYDRLLHYILYPRAQCEVTATVGGITVQERKDGDKILCLEPGPDISKNCIVYSFGINNEWSFDEDMAEGFGCRVYTFDPSMGMSDHRHSNNIWFYNIALGGFNQEIKVGEETWTVMTFDAILKELGHLNKTIDVLKMDIEGAEFPALEDILNKQLLTHVNHLCIELHLLDNPYWDEVFRLLKRIEEAGFNHFSTRNNSIMEPTRVPGIIQRYEQHFFEMAWFRL